MRVLITFMMLLTVLPAAIAKQVLVRNYENVSLEIGQGYLTHYAESCYLLLPTHVAKESGAIAALLGEGSPPALGETGSFADLDDDVTLASVVGSVSTDCGYSAMAISRAIGRLVQSNGLATIRSVNGDGTIAQLSVTLFDDDGSTFLRVQPTNDINQLRKGQSGSLLMAGNTPIGMLLSVDPRFGVGKVIRLDTMLEKFDRHISGGQAGKGAAADAGTLTVTDWSAIAVSPEHRAANLVAHDDALPWIAQVEQWPVALELSLGEERVAIAGVELDGTVEDPSSLPATVEILVSSTADGQRWRSLVGGAINFVDHKAVFRLAPTWARRIRLVFGSSPGVAQITLRRVRVLLAE